MDVANVVLLQQYFHCVKPANHFGLYTYFFTNPLSHVAEQNVGIW